MQTQVLLFYKYVTIDDAAVLATHMRGQAERLNLLGRIIVAEEGINGTVEGSIENTEAFAGILVADERLADMSIKRSAGKGGAFPKLSVRVRAEIVGTRFPKDVDPRVRTAPRVSAEELHEWFRTGDDFVVVDMRNSYEFSAGRFKDSIDPGLENSRDLSGVVDKLIPLKDKKVVTVCTGGVRCEKMSAYLLHKGFSDVHQLQDGIHAYMEKFPGEDFEGTLYTFDQRIVMDFGGERKIVGKCDWCQDATERYVICAKIDCHVHFLI